MKAVLNGLGRREGVDIWERMDFREGGLEGVRREGGQEGVRLGVGREGVDQGVVREVADQGVDREGVRLGVGQEGVGQEGVDQGVQEGLDHREVTPLKARVVVAVASKRRFKGSWSVCVQRYCVALPIVAYSLSRTL